MTTSETKKQRRARLKARRPLRPPRRNRKHRIDQPESKPRDAWRPNGPQPLESTQHERANTPSVFPRMDNFNAIAPAMIPSDPNLVVPARVNLFRSDMPNFTFRHPILTHVETATLISAFDLLTESTGRLSLLNFLFNFFDWMAKHEHAYCEKHSASKAAFYAFGRTEYYNKLVVSFGPEEPAAPRSSRGRDRSRRTILAVAAVDAPLLGKIVEGFVAARRAWLDDRALETWGSTKVSGVGGGADEKGNGPMNLEQAKETKKKAGKAAEEFEMAARALTARLEGQLTMDDGQGGEDGDEGMRVAEGGEGDGKTGSNGGIGNWPVNSLNLLAESVDHWLTCLERQKRLGRSPEWEIMFGQAPQPKGSGYLD